MLLRKHVVHVIQDVNSGVEAAGYNQRGINHVLLDSSEVEGSYGTCSYRKEGETLPDTVITVSELCVPVLDCI